MLDFINDKPHSSQQFSSFVRLCALLQIPRHCVELLPERLELQVVCHEVGLDTMNGAAGLYRDSFSLHYWELLKRLVPLVRQVVHPGKFGMSR